MTSLELPMTDATRAVMRREYTEIRWSRLWTRVAILVGLPLFVAYQFTPTSAFSQVRAIAGPVVLGALGLAAVIVLFLAWSHRRAERDIRLDLLVSHYLRTTGNLKVHYVKGDEGAGWFELYLDDEKLRSPWGGREPPFMRLNNATVDHTPNAHLIFAITDPEGWRVYVAPGYTVPPIRH